MRERLTTFLDRVIFEAGPRNDTNEGSKPYCGNCGGEWPCKDRECSAAEALRLKEELPGDGAAWCPKCSPSEDPRILAVLALAPAPQPCPACAKHGCHDERHRQAAETPARVDVCKCGLPATTAWEHAAGCPCWRPR
jgi:hypothetical protein